jgi:hypothetical protein
MNPEDAVKFVDHAAGANDRWLFVALLIVFLVAIAALAKWGMRQLEIRDARINTLTDQQAKSQETQGDRMALVVANNTAALQANTAALQAFQQYQHRLEIMHPIPPLRDFDPHPTAPRSINPHT